MSHAGLSAAAYTGLTARSSEMHKGKTGLCSQAMELVREALQECLKGSSSMLMVRNYECSLFERTGPGIEEEVPSGWSSNH